MAATVHMRHPDTGGEADFPAAQEGRWAGLGWVPCDPPAKPARVRKARKATKRTRKSTTHPPTDSATADPSTKE